MAFCQDRDVLGFEPTIGRDAIGAASTLALGTAMLDASTLTLPGMDLAARGVRPGHIVLLTGADSRLDARALEVVALGPSADACTVSEQRAVPGDAVIVPAPVGGGGAVTARFVTFGFHIAMAHELLLQRLGIAGLDQDDPLHESRIVRSEGLKLSGCMLALEFVFAAVAGAAGPASAAAERTMFYAKRARTAEATGYAEFHVGHAVARVRLGGSVRRLARR